MKPSARRIDGLVAELKRRKVVRAALVYAAAAFVILQAADLLAGGLRLPDWVFSTITVLVVLGFPLTLVLAWTFDITTGGVQRAEPAAGVAKAPAWLGRGTLIVAGVLLGLGAVLAAGWIAQPERAAASSDEATHGTRTYIVASIVSDRVDVRMVADRFAVSPDGSVIVLVGRDANGGEGLLLRRSDQLEPVRIAGTSSLSRMPVFSPDGRWIAYFHDGAIMKVPVAGGPPVRVAAEAGSRLTWDADDRIRMSIDGRLVTVDATTGEAQSLAFGGDTTVVRGHLLPRGRLLLSLVIADTVERIVVRERNGRLRELVEGYDARYSGAGDVIFVRREGEQRVLIGAALDPRRATIAGELVTLQRDAPTLVSTPAVPLPNGDLVHLAGIDRTDRRIVLLDRRGMEREVAGAGQPWVDVALSPDGSQIAATVLQRGGRKLVTVATATGSMTPVTRSGDAIGARWFPNGRELVFTNIMDQARNGGSMLRVPADGGALPVPISPDRNAYVWQISGDGALLLYRADPSPGQVLPSVQESWILPLHPDSAPRRLRLAGFDGGGLALSPDTRWVAYAVTAADRRETRIRRFDDEAAAMPVARDVRTIGWSRDGRFFYWRDAEVWEIRVGENGPLPATATHAFTLPRDATRPSIMPDGEHLVLIRGGDLYSDLVMVEGALPGRRETRREAAR
jgi:Tol biopolymer transport system component